MKFSLSWLLQHMKIEKSAEDIKDALISLGIEVEKIEYPHIQLKKMRVGKIISCSKHPNATKLSVCMVNIGCSDHVQVVCGAHNVREGLTIAFAPIGATMPESGVTLRKVTLRGIESFGMICSEEELCIPNSTKDGSIVELSSTHTPGTCLYDIYNDPIFDVSVTPNRGDCLSVRGIARELLAYFSEAEYLSPSYLSETPKTDSSRTSVCIYRNFTEETQSACPHYVARVIHNITNTESPSWLKQYLKSAGITPTSAVVDITNYICIDLGYPLHAYNKDAVDVSDITVRLSKKGEVFHALNDREYTLDEGVTVISSDKKLLCLGGLIGSKQAQCTKNTSSIVLEAASFDPIQTAKAGRALNIQTEARFRFERSVDPNALYEALNAATNLICSICGGYAEELEQDGAPPYNLSNIRFPYSLIEKISGLYVPVNESINILKGLGFSSVQCDEEWLDVITPSWRHDINRPADIIEEILRVYGYKKIPSLPLPQSHTHRPLSHSQVFQSKARRLLASRHMLETVCWSMISKEEYSLFMGKESDFVINNPISKDLACMRPTSLPILISAVKKNMDRNLSPISLFEIGPIYSQELPNFQRTLIAGVRYGHILEHHWSKRERTYDVFDVKNDIYALLALKEITNTHIITNELPDYYHPQRSGSIVSSEKRILGHFGELHPFISRKYGLELPLVMFEMYPQENVLPPKKKLALHLSPFQPVERDFSFIVSEKLPASALLETIQKTAGHQVSRMHIFDTYTGSGVGDGKKAIGIRIRLEPKHGTLTDHEIKSLCDVIISSIEAQTGSVLRTA